VEMVADYGGSARLRAPRAWSPAGRGRTKKCAVLNTVLIFILERRAEDKCLKLLARPKRFELLTPRFVVWCSIQLSYGRFRSPYR
jgi:hypothetical protein